MKSQISGYLVLATLSLALPASPAAYSAGRSNGAAQQSKSAHKSPVAVFRSESNLALLRFQVVAPNGYLSDLEPSEIELREDGVAQKIALFEGGEAGRSTRTEVHLLFDCSDSVQKAEKFDPRVFDANILNRFPSAHIAIWGFSGKKLSRFTAPTRDSMSLSRGMEDVRRMKPGDTPIYQSITKVADRLAKAKDQAVRMIVTVSDGLPFGDPETAPSALTHARNAGIALYPTLIYSLRSGTTARRGEWERQLEFLGTGEQSGGRAFEFSGRSAEDLLDRILKGIASEIRFDYVVGYYPESSGAPRSHTVQVVLKNPARGRVVGGGRAIRH